MMIKMDDIDEYASLIALKSYCYMHSANNCSDCIIKQICDCMAIFPCDFNLEFEQKEKTDDRGSER